MKKRIVADLMRIQPDKIILFGSFASKRFRNGKSDIDLLIIKDTHRKYTDRISEARLSLTPNYPFDVFVLTKEELEKKQKESFFSGK